MAPMRFAALLLWILCLEGMGCTAPHQGDVNDAGAARDSGTDSGPPQPDSPLPEDGGAAEGGACEEPAQCAWGLTCREGLCDAPHSCLELLNDRPQTTDGMYRLEPLYDGPIVTFCDMTMDMGGWTLVTPKMIDSEEYNAVTVVRSVDGRGGLNLRTYVNHQGLDGQYPKQTLFLTNRVPWTKIRAHYEFAGVCWGWSLFGDATYDWSSKVSRMEVFDPAVDIIRNQRRMGGAAGDHFDGITHRADATGNNFWYSTELSPPLRSADVILRRKPELGLAGMAIGAYDCSVGPNTSSPTYWQYSEIYVR